MIQGKWRWVEYRIKLGVMKTETGKGVGEWGLESMRMEAGRGGQRA